MTYLWIPKTISTNFFQCKRTEHTLISPVFLIAKSTIDIVQPQGGRERKTCKCLWYSYFHSRSNSCKPEMFFSLLFSVPFPVYCSFKTRSGKTWVKRAHFCVAKCYLSSFKCSFISRIMLALVKLMWHGTNTTYNNFVHGE